MILTFEHHFLTKNLKLILMKIAIPTSDGILVSARPEQTRGFLVATVIAGEILQEVMCWLPQPGNPLHQSEVRKCIAGCDLVIAEKCDDLVSEISHEANVPVLKSSDEIITNVILHYLENEYRNASNLICCP